MKKFFKKIFKYVKKLFTDHPNDLGESYIVHLLWALLYGVYLLCAGIACLIHAVFPFLFTDTASTIAGWVADSSDNRRYYD